MNYKIFVSLVVFGVAYNHITQPKCKITNKISDLIIDQIWERTDPSNDELCNICKKVKDSRGIMIAVTRDLLRSPLNPSEVAEFEPRDGMGSKDEVIFQNIDDYTILASRENNSNVIRIGFIAENNHSYEFVKDSHGYPIVRDVTKSTIQSKNKNNRNS
jgi:hypothetical protein